MKFKVGEKVLVKTYDPIPINWNHTMSGFMGKVVTIRSNQRYDNKWPYQIEEDSSWVWREQDFIELPTDVNDPNYIFMLKRRH